MSLGLNTLSQLFQRFQHYNQLSHTSYREYCLLLWLTLDIANDVSHRILVVNGFRRYPEYAKPALLISAVLFSLSMLAASFATKVSRAGDRAPSATRN